MKELHDEKEIRSEENSIFPEMKLKSTNDLRGEGEDTSTKRQIENSHHFNENSEKKLGSINEMREKEKDTIDVYGLEKERIDSDPSIKEIDLRVDEGYKKPSDGAIRSEFGRQYGQFEHERWEEQVLIGEQIKGNKRGVDFDIEKEFKNPDGDKVRVDYVNYKTDVIVDRKPIRENETKEDLMKRYEEQRTKHIESYKNETGRIASYHYSFYPSTEDLWSEKQNKK